MTALEERNNSLSPEPDKLEIKCHRCYGTGEDDDGADCVFCLGYGTVLV
jgi:hypothetical protein